MRRQSVTFLKYISMIQRNTGRYFDLCLGADQIGSGQQFFLLRIAENEGITRQGVRDSIKRAENQLFDMENRLGLAKRFTEMKKGLDEIMSCANAINDYNLNHSLSREINDNISKIKATAEYLSAF